MICQSGRNRPSLPTPCRAFAPIKHAGKTLSVFFFSSFTTLLVFCLFSHPFPSSPSFLQTTPIVKSHSRLQPHTAQATQYYDTGKRRQGQQARVACLPTYLSVYLVLLLDACRRLGKPGATQPRWASSYLQAFLSIRFDRDPKLLQRPRRSSSSDSNRLPSSSRLGTAVISPNNKHRGKADRQAESHPLSWWRERGTRTTILCVLGQAISAAPTKDDVSSTDTPCRPPDLRTYQRS